MRRWAWRRPCIPSFDQGGTIVVLATRIGDHANIRRRQITDQSVSLDQPGKPHMLFEIQLARELCDACQRISATHEHAIKIASAQVVSQVTEGPDEVVQAILKPHDAEKGDDGLPFPA